MNSLRTLINEMAMKADVLIEKLKAFAINEIDNVANENPIIGFVKPLITRYIDNNANRFLQMSKCISDSEGEIDVKGIVNEMSENLISQKPFTYDTGVFGEIEIGNGQIKIGIPFTTKNIVFDKSDIDKLKSELLKD